MKNRSVISGLVVALLLFVMSCALAGLGIQQGRIVGPEIRIPLGNRVLTGYTDFEPTCEPLGTREIGKWDYYALFITQPPVPKGLYSGAPTCIFEIPIRRKE